MAFSKARNKRFNEVMSCAPGVGVYTIGQEGKVKNIALDKSTRFKLTKEIYGSGEITMVQSDSGSSINSVQSSPGKRSPSAKLLKPSKTTSGMGDLNKQRQLEADVRKLLRERIELDTTVRIRDEEINRLEGKLSKMTKDNLSSTARVAALEKELQQVYKSNLALRKEADQASTWLDEKKQMQYEVNHVKSEIKTKDFEVDELKKQISELKIKVESKIKENEKNLRCLRETKQKLANSRKAAEANTDVWYTCEPCESQQPSAPALPEHCGDASVRQRYRRETTFSAAAAPVPDQCDQEVMTSVMSETRHVSTLESITEEWCETMMQEGATAGRRGWYETQI